MNQFEKIDRYRRGGTVQRYHTHRLIQQPNNAQHQWGVAMLVDMLWRWGWDADANQLFTPPHLILAALYHDVAEFDTGDMPAWVKRGTDLGSHINEIEARVEERLGIERLTDQADIDLLKAADELDHIWTCLDERRLGNVGLTDMFVNGVIRFRTVLDKQTHRWVPYARQLLDAVEAEYEVTAGPEYYAIVHEITADTGGYFNDNIPQEDR